MDRAGIKHHITYKSLVFIWILLLAATAITVFASGVKLGRLNVWLALLIASLKASLVLIFFMHLRYEPRFFTYMFLITITVLTIFMGFTFFDVSFR